MSSSSATMSAVIESLPEGGQRAPFGVIVLGMHRSGTSVAARLLNLMGFSLGPDDDLMPPHRDNPTGYWENLSLVGMNDQILQALGGDWSRPPRLDDGWEDRPEVAALRPAAAELVRSVLGGAERWAFKGPRTCLTLPFWLRILESRLAFIVVHRNPLEVTASLQSRDGFSVPVGLALWERYMRSALAAVEGRPVCMTSYEQVVTDPEGWWRRVADFLRAREIETAPFDRDEVGSFVQPDLRHTSFSSSNLDSHPAVSPEQRALQAALEGAPAESDAFTAPPLPPETPWVGALLDERWRNVRGTEAESALRVAEARLAVIESSKSYRLLSPLRAVADWLVRARAHADDRASE